LREQQQPLTRQLEEGRVRLRRARARDERLARAGGSIAEDAFWRADAQLDEAVRVLDGQYDGLDQLLDLLVEAAWLVVFLLLFFVVGFLLFLLFLLLLLFTCFVCLWIRGVRGCVMCAVV